VLSDIPLIGRLIKNPSKTVRTESLMIFITPTIVGEYTQPEADQLAQADDTIARSLRKEEKTSFGRFAQDLQRGKSDIFVTVGQGGQILCDGNKATLDELRTRFQSVKVPAAAVVILRKHPRAPEDVVSSVADMALESHIRVQVDSRIAAFVPDDEVGKESDEKADEQPQADEKQKPADSAAAVEPGKPAEAAGK
jgi:hypothetical protein